MTGSRYGDFDLNWLLPRSDRRARKSIGRHVEGRERGRGVFAVAVPHVPQRLFHKSSAARGMVKLALQAAKRLAVQDG